MSPGSWSQVLKSAGTVWEWLLAYALAFLTENDSPRMGWAVLLLVTLAAGIARTIQSSLNAEIACRPEAHVSVAKLELRHTVLVGPFAALLSVLRFVRDLVLRKKEPADGPAQVPVLVASTGPSYVIAAAITVGTMAFAGLIEPLLRVESGLTPGYPAWQYLFLGSRVPFGEFVPLAQAPWTHALLTVTFWVVYWFLVARAVRIALAGTIGRNLAGSRDDRTVLGAWRSPLGCSLLHEADESLRSWARWPGWLAAPLLGTSWMALGAQDYRLNPTVYSAALVVWLSWVLLLTLRGVSTMPVDLPEMSPEPQKARRPDWVDAEADLRARLHLTTLLESGPRQRIPGLESLQIPRTATPAGLSELVPQLLAHGDEKRRLTKFQETVLAHLSGDKPGAASPDVLAMAPEGFGKTTLAMLAVCNETLLRSAPSLIVCRDGNSADALRASLSSWLEPAALHWYLRARRAGPELTEELSRGLLPDAVIATLEDLVIRVLGDPEPYHDFLREVALIVVDDVESYCGPIECHCQLAFRRLRERIRSLAGPEAPAPRLLVLGSESMMGMEAWTESLVGADLSVRQDEPRFEPAAAGAPHLRTISVTDFSSATGELIGLHEIIESCERAEVPWHYRPAGDSRRALGLHCLRLPKMPLHHVDDPLDAAVVLVEGSFGLVQREMLRLRRAGARYLGTEEILSRQGVGALIGVVDSDEQSALLQLDRRSELFTLTRPLPRPFIRVPARPISNAHASAELVDNWMETETVLRVFNPEIMPILRDLARHGLLLTEERVELRSVSSSWERLLFLRVRTEAVSNGAETATEPGRLLPPRVSRVEDSADRPVPIRDLSSGRVLRFVDRAAAIRVYFPGRIAADIRGRFIVASASADAEGGVQVEPYTAAEIAVPRRKSAFAIVPPDGSVAPAPRHAVQFGAHGVDLEHGRVQCETEHVATVYLGSDHHELRRIVFAEPSGSPCRSTFLTEALFLYPNPRAGEGPRLTLPAARLIASAMRMVLPSLFRGSEENIDVSLHVPPGDGPASGHDLSSQAAFVFSDLHVDGNGACRAMDRETIELLLRLSRMSIERILAPERLLLRHDHWGDEQELRGILRADEEKTAASRLLGEDLAEARKQALVWLDSRLRPEGTPAVMGPLSAIASGRQPGEGDLFDLGRVWFVSGEGPAALVWARHRWREQPGREGMLDYGIDRRIVLRHEMPAVESSGETIGPLPDGSRPLDLDGNPLDDTVLLNYVRRVREATLEGLAITKDLIDVLTVEQRGGLAARDRARAFVQAIPTTAPVSAESLRSPAWTLVHREGDEASKAILLACLLGQLGERAGLFFSFAGKRAAVAVPIGEVPLQEAPTAAKRAVGQWAKSAGLPEPPGIQAVVAAGQGATTASVYVPLGVSGYVGPGLFRVEKAESWAFVLLETAPKASTRAAAKGSAA